MPPLPDNKGGACPGLQGPKCLLAEDQETVAVVPVVEEAEDAQAQPAVRTTAAEIADAATLQDEPDSGFPIPTVDGVGQNLSHGRLGMLLVDGCDDRLMAIPVRQAQIAQGHNGGIGAQRTSQAEVSLGDLGMDVGESLRVLGIHGRGDEVVDVLSHDGSLARDHPLLRFSSKPQTILELYSGEQQLWGYDLIRKPEATTRVQVRLVINEPVNINTYSGKLSICAPSENAR